MLWCTTRIYDIIMDHGHGNVKHYLVTYRVGAYVCFLNERNVYQELIGVVCSLKQLRVTSLQILN